MPVNVFAAADDDRPEAIAPGVEAVEGGRDLRGHARLEEGAEAPVLVVTGAVKLNATLVTGGNVWSFSLSPDSSHVVYLADEATVNVTELYSVPIGGGTAVKLSGAIVAGGLVSPYSP